MYFALTGMLPGFPAYPNDCLSLLAKKPTFEKRKEKKEGEKNTTMSDFEKSIAARSYTTN